jgi:hypothetical protein
VDCHSYEYVHVLHDLNRTLVVLLRAELPLVLRDIATGFAAPDEKFPPNAKLPALSLFLFSIEEDRELRSTGPISTRHADGLVASGRSPHRVDCHASAFSKADRSTEEDEHRSSARS